ncbi:NAD(P)-binding protein [Dendrothele bispora CBS 962.96]|uniref:NAD(P)-binding protein n=1 Tax=Dendrothele bispora (strain CBS 962.96) TaxID=1314807 RepID=A0A4V4HIS7_DENBC|nr:NAD(P)-binding protein [Dendrothele bispora CBS 962.96]
MLVSGKVVVITGASQGIGRACAQEFAKYGATGLVLHYLGDPRSEEDVQSLKKELETDGRKVATVPGDISDPSTSQKIVAVARETFGRIDVLVSNAGICPFAEFLTMPLETYHKTRAVNLDGSFYVTQAVANLMKEQNPQGGSIIAIASISALVGGALQTHYTPTKAGVLSLMQSCAIALGKYNIRANSVLPGTIATDINKAHLSDPQIHNSNVSRTVLGRLGAPDDIAGPVVFLASDLAKYVTGASLLVDGGAFVNLQ